MCFIFVDFIDIKTAAKHSLTQHKALRHYENTPIQIYRKFHLEKMKIFR